MYGSHPVMQSDRPAEGDFYTLTSDISAIQILPSSTGEDRLSPVSKLPQGAEIAACGNGFDWQTMKVSYQGHFYYVFRRDFEDRDFRPDVNSSN